jgi:hypothetical protein
MQHSMRAYYLPLAAGLLLAVSAFMPWIVMGDQDFGGVPHFSGLWLLGLGLLSSILATLSVITRKNSRHPLLLIGLAALGILLMTEQGMKKSAADQAWAQSQAQAIITGSEIRDLPEPIMALGSYVGLSASAVITSFGLTIMFKRASQPYTELEDDE